jgi:hypothetical protein
MSLEVLRAFVRLDAPMLKPLLVSAACSTLALVGCTTNNTSGTCGSGTALEDGTCQVTVSCGPGTVLQGSTCVSTSSGGSAATPTIAAIDPPNAGIAGLALFTITGTGFAGDNVTDLSVYFGDETNIACKATVGAANSSTIAGEIPPACSLSTAVTVTVTTNLGSAAVPFEYEALFAADGDANPDAGTSNELYVIDPVAGMSFDVGKLATSSGAVGLSGMAFGAGGALFGVTTGDSPTDTAKVAQLVGIDLKTGTVTAIGELKDGAGTAYTVSDMKFTGTTLYAWAYSGASSSAKQGLVTINTTTAVVTPVGTPVAATSGFAGLAINANGAAYVAPNAAAANLLLGDTGTLDTLDMATGAPTTVATLDWPVAAPIHSMAYVGTTLVAVVDDGMYGKSVGLLQPYYGEELVVITPGHAPIVSPAFAAPALVGGESHVSAIAAAPATLQIGVALPREGWTSLAPGSAPTGK